MKFKSLKTVLVALILIFAAILPSCAPLGADSFAESSKRSSINVAVKGGKGYDIEGKARKTVMPGDSVTFTVKAKEGYIILGFSHSNVKYEGDGKYTFSEIYYPTVIEVYYALKDSQTSLPGSSNPPVTDKPSTDRPVTDKPSTDKPSTDKPTTDKPVTNKPTTEKPAVTTEKPDVPALDIEGAENSKEYAESIIYCFNGGSYSDAEGISEMVVFPDNEHHVRVNVFNKADLLTRQGYTLVGWNTESDQSGMHVSLGSRVTLSKKGALVLYASWAKHADLDSFKYKKESGKVLITSCTSSDKMLAVPESIEGLPVTTLCASAFKNLPLEALVLPQTVETIESGAVTDCKNLEKLHFYDSIVSVSNSAFKDCPSFKTLYMNQLLPPVYINEIRTPDAYDTLMLAEKKCLIFFAGSSMRFGVDAYRVMETFEKYGYEAVNVGWMAYRNCSFQLQMINAYAKSGDILIHAPETASEEQLMHTMAMTSNAWPLVDSNMDLFSVVDIRKITKVFSSLTSHLKAKRKHSNQSATYSDYFPDIDDRGYYSAERPTVHGTDWYMKDRIKDMNAAQLTDEGIKRLQEHYKMLNDSGITVYLSIAPFNENCLSESSKNSEERLGYLEKFKTIGYPVLGKPDDFLYDGSYFHDTEYHLTTKGANEHTDKLVSLLLEQMKKDLIIN